MQSYLLRTGISIFQTTASQPYSSRTRRSMAAWFCGYPSWCRLWLSNNVFGRATGGCCGEVDALGGQRGAREPRSSAGEHARGPTGARRRGPLARRNATIHHQRYRNHLCGAACSGSRATASAAVHDVGAGEQSSALRAQRESCWRHLWRFRHSLGIWRVGLASAGIARLDRRWFLRRMRRSVPLRSAGLQSLQRNRQLLALL